MTWYQEWKALDGRIQGLLEAGKFFVQCLSVNSSDPYGMGRRMLLPHTDEVFTQLLLFRERHVGSLPPAAVQSLEGFIERYSKYLGGIGSDHVDEHLGVQARITAMASFQAEFSFYLTDTQVLAKKLTDRAFVHLQRSIVADETIRSRWNAAYSQGEPACEQLGAVHLLQHGIWAFKASGEGERTDLVMGEPLTNLDEAEGAAEALVLTEWKLARRDSEVHDKLAAAKSQASRYATGVLGGFELAQYRYLVIVSERVLQLPPDESVGDIRYRHINIAVDPSAPSKAAQKGRQQGR